MSRVGKIVSNLDLTYDVREETDATQKAVAQRDLADRRASEADDAQAKALVAQSQADALKIMAGDAKKMLEEGIEYSEQSQHLLLLEQGVERVHLTPCVRVTSVSSTFLIQVHF